MKQLVLSALCAASLTAGTALAATLIHNVTVIDAAGGQRPAQTVTVSDGVISAVAPTAGTAPPGAVDGSGRFLIPGLWDMHVHLTYDLRLTDALADLFLRHGITSVRDTGGLLDALEPIVQRWRSGEHAAPRVYVSGPLLDGVPVVYDGGAVPRIGRGHATPAAGRERVDALAAAGVDFVKSYEMVSPEVFDAIVTRAGELGLPVAAHVPLAVAASSAGPRVDSMEHLRNLELGCAENAEALLAERRSLLAAGRADGSEGLALRSRIHGAQRTTAMAAEDPARCAQLLALLHDTIQVPTARLNAMTRYPPFERDGWDSALSLLPGAVRVEWAEAPQQLSRSDDWARLADWTLAMIPRLADAGVPIGAGTDTPIGWAVPGFSLHSELAVLVDAGLSPQQALAAATVVPARFFGLQDRMGNIAPGQVADLVLLDANPLDAIENTRAIVAVMSNGAWVTGAPRATRRQPNLRRGSGSVPGR